MSLPMSNLLREAIARAGRLEMAAPDPVSFEAYRDLLRVLYLAGRVDLPLGRLLEGHVDAVQIVQRYGSAKQIGRLRDHVLDGKTFGVWNAALPQNALRLEGDQLVGGKSFASGAGVIDFALVTADTPSGAQLLLLHLELYDLEINRTWWRTTGMQRSETHQVRWHECRPEPETFIGKPGDYAREPWFSGGVLRYVAVHAGGIASIFDLTRDHLRTTGRLADPFQTIRLGELFAVSDAAAALVERTAQRWFTDDPAARLARVASARLAVLKLAERAMALARETVGVQSMFEDHPLSSVLTDLDVYLRQPVPDLMRQRVGLAAGLGDLSPSL